MSKKLYCYTSLYVIITSYWIITIATILAGITDLYDYGSVTLSIINAIIGFLLGIVNFLN